MIVLALQILIVFAIAALGVRVLRFINRERDNALQELLESERTEAYDEGYRAGLDDAAGVTISGPGESGQLPT